MLQKLLLTPFENLFKIYNPYLILWKIMSIYILFISAQYLKQKETQHDLYLIHLISPS